MGRSSQHSFLSGALPGHFLMFAAALPCSLGFNCKRTSTRSDYTLQITILWRIYYNRIYCNCSWPLTRYINVKNRRFAWTIAAVPRERKRSELVASEIKIEFSLKQKQAAITLLPVDNECVIRGVLALASGGSKGDQNPRSTDRRHGGAAPLRAACHAHLAYIPVNALRAAPCSRVIITLGIQ